jgi:SAM-dependent methyltransferase
MDHRGNYRSRSTLLNLGRIEEKRLSGQTDTARDSTTQQQGQLMKNSSRTWLNRENIAFAQSVPAGSRVLDAGAGHQPYKVHFAHCNYESADFEMADRPYEKPTYSCDLAHIPVEDGRFDAILFNQVMEHLPEPGKVLEELKRVLRPGGRMICTAPLFFEEHEAPYDFFRYTQFGWRHLMAKAGFEVEELRWMEGYLGTVAYQLQGAARDLPVAPASIGPGILGWMCAPLLLACKALFAGLCWVFHALDERQRFTGRGYPKNYVVIVRKLT